MSQVEIPQLDLNAIDHQQIEDQEIPVPGIGEYLMQYQNFIATNNSTDLLDGYTRDIYQTWDAMNSNDQTAYLKQLEPADAADLLRMMFGEPSHSHQPKNERSRKIFEMALSYNPDSLIVEENELPSWIDIVRRFNIGEDGFDDSLAELEIFPYYKDNNPQLWKQHKNLAKKRFNNRE